MQATLNDDFSVHVAATYGKSKRLPADKREPWLAKCIHCLYSLLISALLRPYLRLAAQTVRGAMGNGIVRNRPTTGLGYVVWVHAEPQTPTGVHDEQSMLNHGKFRSK